MLRYIDLQEFLREKTIHLNLRQNFIPSKHVTDIRFLEMFDIRTLTDFFGVKGAYPVAV